MCVNVCVYVCVYMCVYVCVCMCVYEWDKMYTQLYMFCCSVEEGYDGRIGKETKWQR